MSSVAIRTAEDFTRVVQIGATSESLTLEFKRDYGQRAIPNGVADREPRRRAGRKESARDIVQFANTDGGCLLIGVDETGEAADGFPVASGIAPVEDVEGLREWLESAVEQFVVPSTLLIEIYIVKLVEGPVVAVNVPASVHPVSIWDRQEHTIEYVRRTNRGKAWMDPDEMERHRMNGSRAGYLRVRDAVSRARSEQVLTLTASGFSFRTGYPHSGLRLRGLPASRTALRSRSRW